MSLHYYGNDRQNFNGIYVIFTLKPSSPGFSASKSYKAVQHGCLVIGVLAGDLLGDGKGEAVKY